MKYSENRAEIFKAFVKSKKDMEPLIDSKKSEFETKKGGKISFSYAELPHIYSSINEVLATNGITVLHDTYTENRQNFCNTILIHESGEFIESGYLFYDELRDSYGGVDMKGNNGMFTSMRRISLMATLGIASETEANSTKPDPPHTQSRKKWKEAPPVNGRVLEEPPVQEPAQEEPSFTEEIKANTIWSNPNKQGELLNLLKVIGDNHGVTPLAVFDRLQELYKTSYDLDHMADRALAKYIEICKATVRSGKNVMMKTEKERGVQNEPESRESKFLQGE